MFIKRRPTMKMSEKFMKPERRVVFATICAASLALPLFAEQIVPGDYEKVFNIKFVGYKGTTTLTNFPALVRLSVALNDFKYSVCKLENGGDVRFADADGNLLPSEVDTWNPDGESLVWVSVPELKKDTTITVCYGNAAAPSVTPADVWTNGYVGVWPMGAASDSMTQSDSTANPINLRRDRTTSGNDCIDGVLPGVEGRIGAAAEFCKRADRKGAYYGSDRNDKLDGFSAITLEAWTYQETVGGHSKYLLFRRSGQGNTDTTKSYLIQQRTNEMYTATYFNVITNTVDGVDLIRSVDIWPSAGVYTEPALNAWNYHALRYDGTIGRRAQTLNGEHIISWTNADRKGRLQTMGGDFFIGNGDDLWTGCAFPGKIDEVRISSVCRSDDWIMASHDVVVDDGFASYEMENDWKKYSHKFTVSFTNYIGSTTLADFPVLVKISESGISGFRYANCLRPNGADLRFSDAAGNPLDHEIETWNTSGESLVWVKVPSLDASTKITAYYGWSFAPKADPKAVWSNGYVGVWHMGADSGVYTQQDSTTNGLNLTCPDWEYEGFTGRSGVANGVDGIVGKSVAFDQNEKHYGAYAVSDSRHMLDGFSAFTMEAWTFQNDHDPANATERSILYRLQGGNPAYYAYRLYEAPNSGKHGFWFNLEGASSSTWITAGNSAVPTRAEWHYSARSWDGETGNVRGFQDDLCFIDSTDAQSQGKVATIGGQFVVGNTFDTRWGTSAYPGIIDEVRISNVARSADWVKATYDTIKNNSTFTTYSSAREQVKGLMIILR